MLITLSLDLMTQEQLTAFLDKAKADKSIQDQLKAAKSPGNVVEIGKQHGHEFSVERWNNLSASELEGVAGGTETYHTVHCLD